MASSSRSRREPREIERKFLVRSVPVNLRRYRSSPIEQGYFVGLRDGTQMRLRKARNKYWLACKRGTGVARREWEVALNRRQFEKLWPATKGRRLRKRRYLIPWRGLTIEMDVYGGSNRGLVVAEVEFPTVRAWRAFVGPDWLGREVSGRARYSNVLLARD